MITKYFFKKWITNIYNDYKTTNTYKWNYIHNSLLHNSYFDEYHSCNYNKVKGYIFEYLTKYIFILNGYNNVYLYKEISTKTKKELGLPDNEVLI